MDTTAICGNRGSIDFHGLLYETKLTFYNPDYEKVITDWVEYNRNVIKKYGKGSYYIC